MRFTGTGSCRYLQNSQLTPPLWSAATTAFPENWARGQTTSRQLSALSTARSHQPGPASSPGTGCAQPAESSVQHFHPSVPGLPDRALTHPHSLLFNRRSLWVGTRRSPQPHRSRSFFSPLPGRGALAQQWSCLLGRTALLVHEELIYEYGALLAPGDWLLPPETAGTHLLLPKAELQTSTTLILCMHFIISFLARSFPRQAKQSDNLASFAEIQFCPLSA